MPVTIVSEPERWTEKNIGTCYNKYFKIFTVQASSIEEINEWAEKYSMLPHMKSRGNCGDTGWETQQIGALYGVTFMYLGDSSD